MFASLKNKIREETGSELEPHQLLTNNNNNNNNRTRNKYASNMNVNSNDSNDPCVMEQLRTQCNELTSKVAGLHKQLEVTQEEKSRVEQTNVILLESLKVAQTQKDLYCEEQEKIQFMQQNELDKLKSLLLFREQEAVDRLECIRRNQEHIENFTKEFDRLKTVEPLVENLQDELDQVRHSSQLEKNNFTTKLATLEEENRNLIIRVKIMEDARLNVISTLSTDEKIQAITHESKLLQQHLEETNLQLSDIKSNWSSQNLALETQVSRLSNQVAEETTEKRRAIKVKDECIDKIKQLEFELQKNTDEIKYRDDKIKLLEEEIEDINTTLKDCREENEQQVLFERNKVERLEMDIHKLKESMKITDDRFTDFEKNSNLLEKSLREENASFEQKLNIEKEEKLTALLRNAEISQHFEIVKNELRNERNDCNELHEKNIELQNELEAAVLKLNVYQKNVDELTDTIKLLTEKSKKIDECQLEIMDKNKTIKMLNQHLTDLKKSVQEEFNNCKGFDFSTIGFNTDKNLSNGCIGTKSICSCLSGTNRKSRMATSSNTIMDEVNFEYLKHVVLKFLTSREVEARHLIKAVSTLLNLRKEEEKLLHDTLNWRMSWFGSKPDCRINQRAFTIRPS